MRALGAPSTGCCPCPSHPQLTTEPLWRMPTALALGHCRMTNPHGARDTQLTCTAWMSCKTTKISRVDGEGRFQLTVPSPGLCARVLAHA